MTTTPENNPKTSQASQSGNTSNALANQLYRWTFTLKADAISIEMLVSQLRDISKEFTFQMEKSDGTGYYHYQGCFSLKQKEYFNTVKNLFPNSIHLEACKDWWASRKYCSKEETRFAGPWTEKSPIIKTIDPEKFYKWQRDCIKIMGEVPDDRTINWFWEDIGHVGKTSFAKYCAVYAGASLITSGKTADIAYAIGDNPRIVIFNITRTQEERFNYAALEQIKDGVLFSSKYESKVKIFNAPHVFVFANFPPDRRAISEDRWHIVKIDKYADGDGRGC